MHMHLTHDQATVEENERLSPLEAHNFIIEQRMKDTVILPPPHPACTHLPISSYRNVFRLGLQSQVLSVSTQTQSKQSCGLLSDRTTQPCASVWSGYRP